MTLPEWLVREPKEAEPLPFLKRSRVHEIYEENGEYLDEMDRVISAYRRARLFARMVLG